MTEQTNEWVGKKVKIFIQNLGGDKPIIYSGRVIVIDDDFITIEDISGQISKINLRNVIVIREEL